MIGNDGLPSPVWGTNISLSDANLGLIPSWQFDQNPNTNPLLNPHMQYPEGMYQTTMQPTGPYYSGPMLSGLGIDNPFDTWWWKNRKWIVLGTVGALAIGLVGGLAAILK